MRRHGSEAGVRRPGSEAGVRRPGSEARAAEHSTIEITISQGLCKQWYVHTMIQRKLKAQSNDIQLLL